MNGNSRPLVYYNQIGVFVENRKRNVFRKQIDRLNGWFHQNNSIARSDKIARARRASIYSNQTVANKPLNSRTRKLRSGIRQKPIEPHGCVRSRDNKFATI